jgi:AcrR family transcriptional regulator
VTGRGARERILKTAARLFYAHGINNVGVDLVASRSRATKTSLYRHFPSKEKLVAAFLDRINGEWSSWLKARVASASDDPRERLLAVFDALGEWFRTPTFRGCPFINSAAEAADRSSPIAKSAWRFKMGFRDYLLQLSREAGADDPGLLSDQLLLLADGAIVRAAMSGRTGSAAAAKKAARALLRRQSRPSSWAVCRAL